MKMKKLFVSTAILGATVVAMTACGGASTALSSKEDIYGMGAVTAVRLLGSEFSGEAVQRLSTVTALNASATVTTDVADVKAQAGEFHKYLSMLDGFFGEEIIQTNVNEHTDEGFAEYKYKMTITGKDVMGEDVVHTMYYSETLANEEIERGEEEREWRLNGVLVTPEKNYPMRGERSEETEADENEAEIKIRAYLNETDLNTYVQVKQEFSQEANETEREYVYSVYQNGNLLEETKVEFETERRGDTERAEYEVEFLTGTGKGAYEVKRMEKNNQVMLKIEYRLNGKRGEFTVKEVEGQNGEKEYLYTFADGTTLTF